MNAAPAHVPETLAPEVGVRGAVLPRRSDNSHRETRRHLAEATARVREATGGSLADETVRSLVESSYEELARTARVTNYLPVLAERRARERALELARTIGPAAGKGLQDGRPGQTTGNDLLSLLGGLTPIDLDSVMAAAALQDRVDRKYVASVVEIAGLLPMLARTHRVLEIEHRRSSLYSSVYFDTADGQCHLAHAQGRRRRWKARTRRYLDSDLTRLELKVKSTRGRTVKLVRDIDPGQHGRLDVEGLAFLAESLSAHYGLDLERELMPTVEVTYRRVTLVDTAAGQRVTLDSDLTFVGLDGEVVGAMRPDAVLIETKSGALPGPADRLLWRHGIRETHCSKYCIARMLQGSPYQVPGLRRTVRRWFERATVELDAGIVHPVATTLTA